MRIKIPKIFLYRADGSSIFIGSNPANMSVLSFNYTEAEGTDTDILRVRMNVSESYYSHLAGVAKGSDIYFTYGYVHWQSAKMMMKVNDVKSTYGNGGYIVELECKPVVDVEPGIDPNQTIEDLYANIKIVLQIKAREEAIILEEQKATEKKDIKTASPFLTALANAGRDGVVMSALKAKAESERQDKEDIWTIANEEVADAVTQDALARMKKGGYEVKDGRIILVQGAGGAGVTTRGDKIIILADSKDQIAKPSHSFSPNSHIITIVFTSKDKSNKAIEAINGSIDTSNKAESITTILTESGYVALEIKVGTTDNTFTYYKDEETGQLYTAAVSEDGTSLAMNNITSPKTVKAVEDMVALLNKEKALNEEKYSQAKGHRGYYTKSDGREAVAYSDQVNIYDIMHGKKASLLTDAGERTDINIEQTTETASYITHPLTQGDPAEALRKAFDDIDVEKALVSQLEDANFYRNTATITIEGKPSVLQGQTVYVYGFAAAFTGLYLVRKVTHTIGSSGYTTTIVGTRAPETYETTLEKAKAAYGEAFEKAKQERYRIAYKEMLDEIKRINDAKSKNSKFMDTTNGVPSSFEVESELIIQYSIINGDADSGKNYKIIENEEGAATFETKNLKVEGITDIRSSNSPNQNDYFDSKQTNINEKYNEDYLYKNGNQESNINKFGTSDKQSVTNKVNSIVSKNNKGK